jgi:hypothetical protein
MTQTAAPAAPRTDWGVHNLWDMYDLHVSRQLRAANANVFLHFMFSKGSRSINYEQWRNGSSFANFILYGPITDDAMFDGKNLTEPEITGQMKSWTAYESCSLRVKFQLKRGDVRELVPEPEDRERIRDRLYALGLKGDVLSRVAKAIGVND